MFSAFSGLRHLNFPLGIAFNRLRSGVARIWFDDWHVGLSGPSATMPKRSTLRLTKRIVDGLGGGGKDAIFWDLDLARFEMRVHATERKL